MSELASFYYYFYIPEARLASDSAHAGLATITTSPFLTDRVMWGCVRLSELPSSFFMMSSMRSLQWEYTVWGCLPPAPVLPVRAQRDSLFGWSKAAFACFVVAHVAMFFWGVFFLPLFIYFLIFISELEIHLGLKSCFVGYNISCYDVALWLCNVLDMFWLHYEETWIKKARSPSAPSLLKTDNN